MKKYSLVFFIFFFVTGRDLHAQQKLTVYSNATENDTIAETISILHAQLNRSSAINLNKLREDQFGGRGILLSANPARWKAYAGSLLWAGPEGVTIKANRNYVVIIGNSQMAVQHGMFLYLEKLGYRFYFPNPDWYIVPKQLDLYNPFSYTGRPSFDQRRIWYGYGTVGSKTADSNYRFWFKANRLGGSMNAVIGHSYDDIVSRNKETFKEHPEWLYPQPAKGTLPDNPKFDLANPALVQFIIADVLKRLEQAKLKGAPLSMVTLAPSDGIGTCNTPACRELGSVTDRVYSLINRVAKEVRQKYPFTWVSGMSYSEYAAPPTKKLEYNTFVSIATAFNNSKYSTDQLISEWSKKAGKVGIYDYLGLYVWDFDLPGQGAATHVDKVAASIRKYYRLGARGYDAESTPGSISKGLGHYIISHLLWDVNVDITATKKEFFRS